MAGRQIGIGDSPAGNAEPGNAEFGNADVRECGAWECGIRGLPAGPIGPAETVPPEMVPPIGGTVPGGTVRCRAIARHGEWCRPIGRHRMVPPIGGTVCRRRIRRRPAEPPADRPAAGARGGGVACVGAPGRLGVLPSCGTAGAARLVWCRLGMVPPIGGTVHGGAVHGGTVLPGGCGPAWIWCLQLEARFRAGAVPWRRGSGDCAGPGEGACQKTVCWPGWLGRAPGCGERGRRNGVWGCGAGVRGTGPEERRLGVRRRGAGNGAGGTASGGAAPGCEVWERKAGAEAGYPSKDAGKLKRDGAARKQGMRGVGAAKGDAGEMLQEGKLRS